MACHLFSAMHLNFNIFKFFEQYNLQQVFGTKCSEQVFRNRAYIDIIRADEKMGAERQLLGSFRSACRMFVYTYFPLQIEDKPNLRFSFFIAIYF